MSATDMAARQLGSTELRLSVIGFGAWAIGGGGWKFGWGSQDDERSIAAIHEAIDRGVNWIDTARVYGLGRSERVVAEALKGVDRPVHVVTKCTRVWDEHGEITGSMRRDSIMRELEASTRALDGRTIDVYLIHQAKPDSEIEEGWRTLLELKETGAVRYVGVSNFSIAQMRRAAEIGPIDVIEPSYSLIERSIEDEILPYCEENGVGVIAYSPMGSGLLTGHMNADRVAAMDQDDWRKHDPRFNEPQLSRHLALTDRLATAADDHGVSTGAAACGWVLGDRRVHAAIVGFRDASQVAEILGSPPFFGNTEALEDLRDSFERIQA